MANAPAVPATPAAPATVTPASQTMTTTTPTATTSTTAATTTTPSADPAPWTSALSEDARAFVATKGFKDPAALLDSYRNFEKLHGVPQDRLLKLPENMDSPEGRAILEKMGLPKTAADYGFEKYAPKEDPKAMDKVAAAFHEAGVPRAAAEKFVLKMQAEQVAAQTAAKENHAAMITQGDTALKKEWGQAYDQNLNIAKQGVNALGLDGKTLDALESIQGREKLFKMLHKIGAGIGEATFVAGRPAADGILAPEQARSKIRDLMVDKAFVSRMAQGDKDAKSQWQKLHEMAHPGEFTI